mgnify:CR=1 FL=1
MSINAIEKALWTTTVNPAEAQRAREDAAAFFQSYRVSGDEIELLLAWDVNALLIKGVHPMVMMMAYTAINGPGDMGEYVQKIHTPSPTLAS